jgi:ElaB/YqjD/DUF883 family membrane-anchored ribosome-binding protein
MPATKTMSNHRSLRSRRNEADLLGKLSAVTESMQGAIDDLKEIFSERGSEMLDSVKDLGSEAGHAASEGFQQVRDTAGEYIEKTQERAVDLERSMEKHIRNNPVKSILIATGAGCLLGIFLLRR